MDSLSIAIVLFCIMEGINVLVLYRAPHSKLFNGVGVFDGWEDSKKDEPLHLFVRYMTYWVAGTKLIFVVLLLIIFFTGTEITKLWTVAGMIGSIMSYFWKLHPIIKKLDEMGKITPKGYSKILGWMIRGFLVMFVGGLVFYLLNQ